MKVSTDASQYKGKARADVLGVPGYRDDPKPIQDWWSCLPTPPRRIIRTARYDIRTSAALLRAVDALRHDQRALYNRTIACVGTEGGDVPAVHKTIKTPDGLYGQLTHWRAETGWLQSIPVQIARPALAQARGALKAHEHAVDTRVQRLLDEDAQWRRWMAAHPEWDSGAWDALPAEDKREQGRAGHAPPKSLSTWGDERRGDGSRQALHRTRKTSHACAVVWNTPPRRIGANVVRLPGLSTDIKVRTRKGLPAQPRLRAAKICTRIGHAGKRTLHLHLSVATDVQKTHRADARIGAADAGTGSTLIRSDGWRLTLPEHEKTLEECIALQRAMARCKHGSRQWSECLESYRGRRRAMRNQDHDTVRKAAREIARNFDLFGLESLKIVAMGTSARARGGAGVSAKTKLNRAIRRALWGFTRQALESAFEATAGTVIYVPAAYTSQTCSRCGHTDAESRRRQDFLCTKCGYLDDADENAAAVVEQRTTQWYTLLRAGCTPAKATDVLWKTRVAAARKCAGNAKAQRDAVHKGESQAPGGPRPAQHTARRVPRRNATKAGPTPRGSRDSRAAQSAQPVHDGTNSLSI